MSASSADQNRTNDTHSTAPTPVKEGSSKKGVLEFIELLTKIAGSILLPLVIFFVGNKLSSQQKEADGVQRQADRVTALLKHYASHDSTERNLALAVSKELAREKQLPVELLSAIELIIAPPTLVKNAEEVKVSETSRLGIAAINAANAVNDVSQTMVTRQESTWVYLGAHDSVTNRWLTNNFYVKNVPSPSEQLVANTDTYRRNAQPHLDENGWHLGEVSGIVNEGDRVTVQRIVMKPGVGKLDLIWALVKPLEQQTAGR